MTLRAERARAPARLLVKGSGALHRVPLSSAYGVVLYSTSPSWAVGFHPLPRAGRKKRSAGCAGDSRSRKFIPADGLAAASTATTRDLVASLHQSLGYLGIFAQPEAVGLPFDQSLGASGLGPTNKDIPAALAVTNECGLFKEGGMTSPCGRGSRQSPETRAEELKRLRRRLGGR